MSNLQSSNGDGGSVSVPNKSLQQEIEQKTLRTLTMRSTLTDGNLARCHLQSQSPLYHTLPKELRDIIFAFATSPYEDKDRQYSTTKYYYRPGHTAPHRTCTNLLRTCRRVWLEANALPMQQAEHAFWFQRGPHDLHAEARWNRNVLDEHKRYNDFLSSLTISNVRNLSLVHLFLQMHKVEDIPTHFLSRFFQYQDYHDQLLRFSADQPGHPGSRAFRPEIFQITIRHSDWTNWERDDPLALKDAIIQHVLDSSELRGCKQFRLELETLESKKDQLQIIVDRLARLEGKAWAPTPSQNNFDGSQFAWKLEVKDEVENWHWRGPTSINDEEHTIYEGIDKLHYHVAIITWRSVKCAWHADYPTAPGSLQRDFSALRPAPPPPMEPHYLTTLPNSRPRLFPGRRIPNVRRMGTSRGVYMAGPFLQHDDHGWEAAVRAADRGENMRRLMFLQVFGDMRARELSSEWETKGSLLEFEE